MDTEMRLANIINVQAMCGRALSLVGLAAWSVWIAWQMTMPVYGLIGIAAMTLEILALVAAAIVSAGLWSVRDAGAAKATVGASVDRRTVPEVMAAVLSVDSSMVDVSGDIGPIVGGRMVGHAVGADDTGEVAWARRGLHILGRFTFASRFVRSGSQESRRKRGLERHSSLHVADAAWSVIAVDGLRRLLMVALLIVVLFTGQIPFDVPPMRWVAVLVGGLVCVSVGHWLLSGGRLRPGARQVWSMASIGAGLGDGVSRSGLPIRWMATMATMVVLNLAISLRGLSDRWTHGLGAMAHDARVAAMSLGLSLVALGFLALRTLPQPDLDFYGATRRLEETSTRRLALGATVGIAVLGFVAGVMPLQQ